jgi:hypothetical protein
MDGALITRQRLEVRCLVAQVEEESVPLRVRLTFLKACLAEIQERCPHPARAHGACIDCGQVA